MQTILRAAARRAKVARVTRNTWGRDQLRDVTVRAAGSQLVPRRCTLTGPRSQNDVPQLFHRRRMNTSVWSSGSSPSISIEQAITCFETISTYLDVARPNAMLKEIRQSREQGKPLADRWQEMFNIYLQLQVHVIHPFGYSADQQGLTAFNMNVGQVVQSIGMESEQGKELFRAQAENWEIMLDTAFGVKLENDNVLDLEKCRLIAANFAMKLQSDEITRRIETEIVPISDGVEKTRKLMEIVVAANINTLEKFGLEGEDGYVLYQASTMQYAGDMQITQSMQPAMMHVQLKAGVSPAM